MTKDRIFKKLIFWLPISEGSLHHGMLARAWWISTVAARLVRKLRNGDANTWLSFCHFPTFILLRPPVYDMVLSTLRVGPYSWFHNCSGSRACGERACPHHICISTLPTWSITAMNLGIFYSGRVSIGSPSWLQLSIFLTLPPHARITGTCQHNGFIRFFF